MPLLKKNRNFCDTPQIDPKPVQMPMKNRDDAKSWFAPDVPFDEKMPQSSCEHCITHGNSPNHINKSLVIKLEEKEQKILYLKSKNRELEVIYEKTLKSFHEQWMQNRIIQRVKQRQVAIQMIEPLEEEIHELQRELKQANRALKRHLREHLEIEASVDEIIAVL